jgi:hypothetical protein
VHIRSSVPPTCITELRVILSRTTGQVSGEPTENLESRSWLPRPSARYHARRSEYIRYEQDQQLAWRVEDILVGRGLAQTYFTIRGRGVHVPQVLSLVEGPPVGLNIRTLPGQTPDDFRKHAPAIADNLGISEVQVVRLGPSLLRLDLVP